MQQMGKRVAEMLPSDFGFAILVFPLGSGGESNYISNADRSDMIKALRETANRLENKEDYGTPDNNMY